MVKFREEAPEGKLDLLISADFRMTSTTLLSDIVFPAATWYEKYDLSSTDMHPFVHAFTPAIDPPWEAKSDFDVLHPAGPRDLHPRQGPPGHPQRPGRRPDAARHPRPDQPARRSRPRLARAPTCRPSPGKNLPALMVVERDYTAIADKLATVGPLADRLGFTVKNITYDVKESVALLGRLHGVMSSRRRRRDVRRSTPTPGFAEAILAFSGTTNGALATQGFHDLEAKTGRKLVDLSEGQEERRITFAQTQEAPQPVITSPEWSGSETGGRRYAAFTINTERLKPWHTLTGRMHFFLDHDWMIDAGEQLPTFRPPLDMARAFGEPELGPTGEKAITLRYLTVHNKWSIHSEYQDNLFMLSLGRGGPQAWLSVADAAVHRGRRQRLDRADQRQRRVRGPGGGDAQAARRHLLRAACPGADDRRPQVGGHRQARRHPQLGDPDPGEADPPDRRRTRTSRTRSTTSAPPGCSATSSPPSAAARRR